MKSTGVLFTPQMVSALLRGQKFQTRRTSGLEIINENPDYYTWLSDYPQMDIPRPAVKYDSRMYFAFTGKRNNSILSVTYPPYGRPGDELVVKETHYKFGQWVKNGKTKTGKQKWKFVSQKGVVTKYTENAPPCKPNKFRGLGWYKRPSLFMSFEDARIFLKIESIRPERLHEISESDAEKEGATKAYRMKSGNFILPAAEPLLKKGQRLNYKDGFQLLWQIIHGVESWNQNPWVWVITFTVHVKK